MGGGGWSTEVVVGDDGGGGEWWYGGYGGISKLSYDTRLKHPTHNHQLGMSGEAAQAHILFFEEANETSALGMAKTKLEKQLEDITWQFQLEKKLRVSNEEAKSLEISKLQKTVESLRLGLDAAKIATVNECNKNAVLQVEFSMKEKSAMEGQMVVVAELRNEYAFLKNSVNALEKKNSILEQELVKAKECTNEMMKKLWEVEKTCSQLQQKLQSLEEENHVLWQKTLGASPKSNNPGFVKPLLEENYEFLSSCIKEDLGFKDGKPVAACVIYECLDHCHGFESERTSIFDYIIEGINDVLKVGDENVTLPYWLSNASALLCLLQRNLLSNGLVTAAFQRSGGPSGLNGRIEEGLKSPFKYIGFEDGISHVEARYPAILFKQQLTACVEKIFGMIRDNLKKEISPLLGFCIQAPNFHQVHGGKSSRSPGSVPQQSPSSQWDSIISFLDSLMSRLRENHVPSFFVRKIATQVFSFINISLFNSLLLRRECCTFANGEYVKSGLAELEKWIVGATAEFAGTSWHELNYIRQAVGFLVIHGKRKKSLDEIMLDLCPALTVRQIYRISTTYWDDKYGTQSVSNEVVAQMREILNKDSQNLTSNSFLLDDDLSIPFSAEDIYMALPAIDPALVELPKILSGYAAAQSLVQPTK